MSVPTVAAAAAKKTTARKTAAKKAAPAPAVPAAKAPAGPPPASRRRAAAKAAQARTRAGTAVRGAVAEGTKAPEFSLGEGSAHRIVAAEFALCVVLVGMSPVVMRNPTNGHVYVPNDFVRLSAVALVFFVLALMSNNARGSRIAAAFGALVTLGVLYNASSSLTALGSIFVNSTKNKGAVSTAAEGTATFDTATYTPGLDTGPVNLGGTAGQVST